MNITHEQEEAHCPINGCNEKGQFIESTGFLRKNHISYHTVHENEYTKHIEDENGNTYIMKYNPPRTNRPFLGEC